MFKESTGVEEVLWGNTVDVEATLRNLSNYAQKYRQDFGNPDLTVLVTG